MAPRRNIFCHRPQTFDCALLNREKKKKELHGLKKGLLSSQQQQQQQKAKAPVCFPGEYDIQKEVFESFLFNYEEFGSKEVLTLI